MPNWNSITIKVTGSQEDLDNFKNDVASDRAPMDFDKIVPEPDWEWKNHPNSSLQTSDKKVEVGGKSYDWYWWRVNFWGTKWHPADITLEEEPGKLTYDMEIANGTGVPILNHFMEHYPKLLFEVNGYYDMLEGWFRSKFTNEDMLEYKGGDFDQGKFFKLKSGQIFIVTDSITDYLAGEKHTTTLEERWVELRESVGEEAEGAEYIEEPRYHPEEDQEDPTPDYTGPSELASVQMAALKSQQVIFGVDPLDMTNEVIGQKKAFKDLTYDEAVLVIKHWNLKFVGGNSA